MGITRKTGRWPNIALGNVIVVLASLVTILVLSGAQAFGQYSGIGVVDPTTALDVNGTGLFRNGNTATNFTNDQLLIGSATFDRYKHSIKSRHNSANAAGNALDFYLWDAGVDALLTTGTQHVMTLEGFDGGRVGIGTTSPDAKLHVNGTGTTTAFQLVTDQDNRQTILLRRTNNANEIGIGFQNSGLAFGSAIFHRDQSEGDGLGEGLSIASIGNDVNPQNLGETATFKTDGTVRFHTYGTGTNDDASPARMLGVQADGDLVEVPLASLVDDENIYTTDGTIASNRAVTQGNFDLNFDANTLVVDGSANRVGIGTAAPVNRLTVGAPIAVGSYAYAEASATIFTNVTNGGNAIAAPAELFHLAREGVGGQAWGNRASFALSRYENSSVNSRTQLDFNLSHTGFNTDNTVLSLRSSGNVGIGTSSPDARLDVEGGRVRFSDYGNNAITGTATSILGVEADGDLVEVSTSSLSENIYNTNGTLTANRAVTQGNFDLNFDANTLVVSGDDNFVGIGTDSPTEKLQISNGVIYANGEGSGLIVDNVGKRVGLMKYNGKEAGIWRIAAQDFEIGRITGGAGSTDVSGVAGNTYTTDLYVADDGNVGIGTTGPGSRLEVAGRTTTTDFTMTNGATNGYVLQSNAAGDATWVDAAALAVTGDNLGDHTATENIQTNGFWLSNDGGDEGVFVEADGDVLNGIET
ncbi:MAG: hypothetical protein AB8F78_19870 [Saprospiraceae bacterium]